MLIIARPVEEGRATAQRPQMAVCSGNDGPSLMARERCGVNVRYMPLLQVWGNLGAIVVYLRGLGHFVQFISFLYIDLTQLGTHCDRFLRRKSEFLSLFCCSANDSGLLTVEFIHGGFSSAVGTIGLI